MKVFDSLLEVDEEKVLEVVESLNIEVRKNIEEEEWDLLIKNWENLWLLGKDFGVRDRDSFIDCMLDDLMDLDYGKRRRVFKRLLEK